MVCVRAPLPSALTPRRSAANFAAGAHRSRCAVLPFLPPSAHVTTTTADFLATVPLFGGLERVELERFAELTREKFYPKGSVILFENDPGDSLFVVRQGRVKVVLIGEDGREVILGVLGVGEHFGELSLIDDRPRSAHVIAMEDSSLLVLRREDFRRRVESSPAVAWSLLTEMSRRLRRADEKIGGLVLLDVPGRIARLLLDLAAQGAGPTIDKPLTHQTIAQMIGASRETVSRAMKEFQDAGWITVVRRRIAIANRDAMEQRAQARV
jgi:CRP/FNR family transcriptional regulator, cyclic AMP receptor protein